MERLVHEREQLIAQALPEHLKKVAVANRRRGSQHERCHQTPRYVAAYILTEFS